MMLFKVSLILIACFAALVQHFSSNGAPVLGAGLDVFALTSPSLDAVASNRTLSFIEINSYTRWLSEIRPEAAMRAHSIHSFVTSTLLPCVDDVRVRAYQKFLSPFFLQVQQFKADLLEVIFVLYMMWLIYKAVCFFLFLLRQGWKWFVVTTKATVAAGFFLFHAHCAHCFWNMFRALKEIALADMDLPLLEIPLRVFAASILLGIGSCCARLLIWLWQKEELTTAARLMIQWLHAALRFPFECCAEIFCGAGAFLGYSAVNLGCMLDGEIVQDVFMLIWVALQVRWLYCKAFLPALGYYCWLCGLLVRVLGLNQHQETLRDLEAFVAWLESDFCTIRSIIKGRPEVIWGNDQDCVICLEAFEQTAGKRLPCGHVFHCKCLSNWEARASTCPVCRHPLPRKISSH